MSRLLDAIKRARRPQRFDPDGDPGPPIALSGRRVLLIYLFPNLGDVVLLAPAVKALLDAGADRVGVLLRKKPARIFKLIDLPARVHLLPEALELPARAAGHTVAWAQEEVVEEAEYFAETLAGKYDVAVDLTARADIESRRWLQGSEAPHRLGWRIEGERPDESGLTWATPDNRHLTDRHWSRYQMLPLRCLGVSEPAFDLAWTVKAAARTKAEALYGSGDGPRILLVPGAQAAAKRWPAERFAEVGGRAARELGARLVVTGAPDEAPLVRQLVVDIGGQTSPYTGRDLATLVALVQRADAVLTNDTAPMHLAFLTGRPTVAIFTWMSAVCWGPPTRDPRFVVLNAPPSDSAAAAGAYTRAVHQQLLRLLAT